MNRILIMCEGPNEKKIIDILLDNGCLKFSQDDLLGLTAFHVNLNLSDMLLKITSGKILSGIKDQ